MQEEKGAKLKRSRGSAQPRERGIVIPIHVLLSPFLFFRIEQKPHNQLLSHRTRMLCGMIDLTGTHLRIVLRISSMQRDGLEIQPTLKIHRRHDVSRCQRRGQSE